MTSVLMCLAGAGLCLCAAAWRAEVSIAGLRQEIALRDEEARALSAEIGLRDRRLEAETILLRQMRGLLAECVTRTARANDAAQGARR